MRRPQRGRVSQMLVSVVLGAGLALVWIGESKSVEPSVIARLPDTIYRDQVLVDRPYTTATPTAEPTLTPTAQPTKKPVALIATPTPTIKTPYRPNRVFPADTLAARYYALEILGRSQFLCLDVLWDHESGWRTLAENKSSGAYGIPQALPGTKMAKIGPDWKTNPMTQVKWGLGYIHGRYGTACSALDHWYMYNWY